MAATATSSRPSSLAICSKESFLAAFASNRVEAWTGRRGAREDYTSVSHRSFDAEGVPASSVAMFDILAMWDAAARTGR